MVYIKAAQQLTKYKLLVKVLLVIHNPVSIKRAKQT